MTSSKSLSVVGAVALLGLVACGPLPTSLTAPLPQRCEGTAPAAGPIRVVSFNIKSGLSSSVESIGDFLASLDADVIALQEVDMGVERTDRVRQAEVLAERVGHQFAFAASMDRGGGEYGVALLSRLPFARTSRIDLTASGAFEPRVAIDADLCMGDKAVRVVTVHADIFPWSAAENAKTLAEKVRGTAGSGLVIAGDLNATPGTLPERLLRAVGLADLIGRHAEGPTFGQRRLDYIFADSLTSEPSTAERIDVDLSDHLPIVAELPIPEV